MKFISTLHNRNYIGALIVLSMSAVENPPSTGTDAPFDYAPFKAGTVLDIAAKLQDETLSDDVKYQLAKLMLEKTKGSYIDPMKDQIAKERESENKQAEARAAVIAATKEKIGGVLDEEFMAAIHEASADYITQGFGAIVSIEITTRKDDTTGEIKTEFTSNLAKARAKTTPSGRTGGPRTAGTPALVSGSPKEGKKGVGDKPLVALPSEMQFDSFAAAARHVGLVDDTTELRGVNCKRLLESAGYSCKYAAVAADGTKTGTDQPPVPTDANGAEVPVEAQVQ